MLCTIDKGVFRSWAGRWGCYHFSNNVPDLARLRFRGIVFSLQSSLSGVGSSLQCSPAEKGGLNI